MRKHLLFFIIIAACIAGYAADTISVPRGYTRRSILGLQIGKGADNRIIVTNAEKSNNAGKAGIRKGDILKSIDGIPIIKRIDVIKTMNSNYPSEAGVAKVAVERDGKEKLYKVKTSFTVNRTDCEELVKMLWDEKKVSLAIIIGEINSLLDKGEQLEQLKKAIKINLLSNEENYFLKSFGSDGNFTLVDRKRVEELINELKINQTGLTSDKFRNNLGELLGVTHMLFIELTRESGDANHYFNDIIAYRLIEVETGKVIASFTTVNPSNPKTRQ